MACYSLHNQWDILKIQIVKFSLFNEKLCTNTQMYTKIGYGTTDRLIRFIFCSLIAHPLPSRVWNVRKEESSPVWEGNTIGRHRYDNASLPLLESHDWLTNSRRRGFSTRYNTPCQQLNFNFKFKHIWNRQSCESILGIVILREY